MYIRHYFRNYTVILHLCHQVFFRNGGVVFEEGIFQQLAFQLKKLLGRVDFLFFDRRIHAIGERVVDWLDKWF